MSFRERIGLIGRNVTDEDVVSNLWVLACANCRNPWIQRERESVQCCAWCYDLRQTPRLVTFDEVRQICRGKFGGIVRFQDGMPWQEIPEGIRSIPIDVLDYFRERIQVMVDRGDVHIMRRREATRKAIPYGPHLLQSLWRKFARQVKKPWEGNHRPRAGKGFAAK